MFLKFWDLFKWYFYVEIVMGDYDGIGKFNDFIKMVDCLRFFDFCKNVCVIVSDFVYFS